MKYKVEISDTAEIDLRDIYEHIAFTLGSVQNAMGQIYRLEKSIMSLDTMPMRFQAYEREPWYSRGLRTMPVDNFLVFYSPFEEKATVTIIRIMYSRRDFDKQLVK